MPTFKVDYSYYTDLKYGTLMVEATDVLSAENQAEEQFDNEDLINPMIETIEEIKV